MTETDPKNLQAADGDDNKPPKDEEVSPAGRFSDYPLLSQDKGAQALEAPAEVVEAVFRLPQPQDAVKLIGGEQKKAMAAIKRSPKRRSAGKYPGCINNAARMINRQ